MWKVLNCVLKLSESVLGFTLKREQELSMRHIFNFIDVMAVFPTEFGKSLIFQMFVMMCGVRNKKKNEQVFAPKLGHVTRCVTRDGLTLVLFLNLCYITSLSFFENKSSRKFSVFVALKVRDMVRNIFEQSEVQGT